MKSTSVQLISILTAMIYFPLIGWHILNIFQDFEYPPKNSVWLHIRQYFLRYLFLQNHKERYFSKYHNSGYSKLSAFIIKFLIFDKVIVTSRHKIIHRFSQFRAKISDIMQRLNNRTYLFCFNKPARIQAHSTQWH